MIPFLRQHFLVLIGCLFSLEHSLPAESSRVRALELKEGISPPELDGVLNDPCWEKAEAVTNFSQVFPKEGTTPSEPTEVKFAHDGRYLYVAIRCTDREPNRITARDLQRDSFEEESFPTDDHVQVALDPFGRERDGFLFAVNPLGALTDGRIESGGSTAKEWDGIWDARAQRDAQGWTAELRIPFSTLSFDPAEDSWGVNVQRVIRRKEEMIRWAQPSQSREGDWLDDIAQLDGMNGLNQGLGIEIKPYTVLRHLDEVDGGSETELRGGFDANWLITPALTATITVNTDFAEAEVDDRQINLTRFPLFFPEKRDFFLRDAPYFNFPYGTALMMPFFSRTIGRSAEGEPVDILVGAKFTGRAGPYTIGILDVQQDAHDGIDEKNLLVARVTRELAADHTLGAIITHGDPYSNGDNTVLGLDYQWRTNTFMGDKNFDLQTWLIGSDTTDAGTGTTFGATFGYTNQPWYLYGIFAQIGEEFYPAMGYLARQGVREYYFVATYQWQINKGGLRTFEVEMLPIIITRLDGEIETADISLPGLEWGWDSGAELSLWLSLKEEQFFEPFEIQPGVVVPVGDYKFHSVQAAYEGAPSRMITPNAGFEIGEFLNGDIVAWNVGLEYRPSPYVNLGISYAEQAVDLPQGEFTTRLASVNLKLAFSPRLSWNTLAQYDNESDSFGVNSRIRWTVRPGTDVYLVLNQGYVVEERNRLRRVGTEAALKAGVTWRF